MINLFVFLFPPVITSLLLVTIAIVSEKVEENAIEETSPFECGIDPNSNSRTPFSARFFLLAVLFLIFDIETVLLLGLPYSNNLTSIDTLMIGTFILILVLGLVHEWREQSLNWSD